MWLLIAFVAVPLIEIALFIQVGGAIGLWPTLLVVIVTAFLGSYLVRSQGSNTLAKLQSSFNELNDPTEPLAHGAMILFAGALLLTPGFFTDALGFLLMVPGFRTAAFNYLRKRVKVQSFTMGGDMGAQRHSYRDPNTIDGEFEEVHDPQDQPQNSPQIPSGWTKH